MSGETFDPEWLGLRERVDHRARAGELVSQLRSRWEEEGWSRVVDLGAGRGSNLRYLAPRLPGPQHWTLLDQDEALLERAGDAGWPDPVETVESVAGDLAAEGLKLAAHTDLVTASALLDLVSEAWLRELAIACEGSRAGVLLTLTYDGSITWDGPRHPPDAANRPSESRDPTDGWIRRAVNLHQRRDKGLGPALGPAATDVADALLRMAGYDTWQAPSVWHLGPDDRDLSLALIDGWETAACEAQPQHAERFRAWAERRRKDVREGLVWPTVGHVDLLALPRRGEERG